MKFRIATRCCMTGFPTPRCLSTPHAAAAPCTYRCVKGQRNAQPRSIRQCHHYLQLQRCIARNEGYISHARGIPVLSEPLSRSNCPVCIINCVACRNGCQQQTIVATNGRVAFITIRVAGVQLYSAKSRSRLPHPAGFALLCLGRLNLLLVLVVLTWPETRHVRENDRAALPETPHDVLWTHVKMLARSSSAWSLNEIWHHVHCSFAWSDSVQGTFGHSAPLHHRGGAAVR